MVWDGYLGLICFKGVVGVNVFMCFILLVFDLVSVFFLRLLYGIFSFCVVVFVVKFVVSKVVKMSDGWICLIMFFWVEYFVFIVFFYKFCFIFIIFNNG